jgi:hypothetical protein
MKVYRIANVKGDTLIVKAKNRVLALEIGRKWFASACFIIGRA